jgi:hypothetical protein
MKKSVFILMLIAVMACKQEYPPVIHIDGGRLHVQGVAMDQKSKLMYCSFTSAFFKADLEGNIIGSITGINGHLGAMTFDAKGRKVYASLEVKDDAIGKGIADALGAERHERSSSNFYVAEIDVDKVTGLDIPFDEAVVLHPMHEVRKDYLESVTIDGQEYEHRYGCSGMDGITIGPGFGKSGKRKQCLYVAYGIYADMNRKDNDHNVLLCFDLDDLSQPVAKYFVHTGNTRYGVQNLAYDKATKKLYLAVYKGSKPQYPNYSMFTLDMKQEPFVAKLSDVPYEESEVLQLKVSEGSHFKWGSTGLCPLGDGSWYISHQGKADGSQYCDATLYNENPFLTDGANDSLMH